jgi:hypothetical protein
MRTRTDMHELCQNGTCKKNANTMAMPAEDVRLLFRDTKASVRLSVSSLQARVTMKQDDWHQLLGGGLFYF